MIVQSPRSLNRDSFETPPWESQVWAVMSQMSPKLLVACLSTKGAPECELPTCWLV